MHRLRQSESLNHLGESVEFSSFKDSLPFFEVVVGKIVYV